MTAIFLSDVHLRDAGSVKTKLVVRFLQQVASRFERIYILGDLFDVWPGTSAHLVRTYKPVIQALKHLVEDGHSVHYLEGNHDFHLGDYFTDALGIQVYPDAITEEWNGQRVCMMHGDLGNPKDLGYRALRYLLRRETVHMVKNFFPQEWVYQLGLNSSKLSRKYQGHFPTKEDLIRQTYRRSAETLFEKGYDIVLMGHTHIPDDYSTEINGRKCRYINTGDWVRHFTYLEFDGSQFYTRTHPVKEV
jgi:UDP-2,3-diacylglucosamine hydrolase